MKNKGRKHLATSGNCKGFLTGITRDITKMGSGDKDLHRGESRKWMKNKWSKRVRGYFKSKTKEGFNLTEETN